MGPWWFPPVPTRGVEGQIHMWMYFHVWIRLPPILSGPGKTGDNGLLGQMTPSNVSNDTWVIPGYVRILKFWPLYSINIWSNVTATLIHEIMPLPVWLGNSYCSYPMYYTLFSLQLSDVLFEENIVDEAVLQLGLSMLPILLLHASIHNTRFFWWNSKCELLP